MFYQSFTSFSNTKRTLAIVFFSWTLGGCLDSNDDETTSIDTTDPVKLELEQESTKLESLLATVSPSGDVSAYVLPDSDDLDSIPQDPANNLTQEKVTLGKLLFHETGLSTNGVNPELSGTWSCASCHHAAAGFKAGVKQGIGEGGFGFSDNGANRKFADGFSADSTDPSLKPDVQPIASPTVLNTAYQDVMLWNGQFGNAINGIVNASVPLENLNTPDTPKAENTRALSGLEIQAIAGLGVHRMKVTEDSVLQTNQEYVALFEQAFPEGSDDVLQDAGLAIAAYERTVLANQAPFQKWLRGDKEAMTLNELKGANLFFDKANCHSCHRGPALSSEVDAAEYNMFFALGFNDLDPNDPSVTGMVDEATSLGRGGFTGDSEYNYKFKVPQLYNLKDSDVFGHGGSFSSVQEVIEYKNEAIAQNQAVPLEQIDANFYPLYLTEQEIQDLTVFLENALYDPNLSRYVPESLPTGNCPTVADEQSKLDQGCN